MVRKLLKYVLHKADRVISVSNALKEAMLELDVSEDKIDVIPNGVDGRKFFPIPKEEARKKLGVSDQKMLLSVGSLTRNKGFDILIRAFKILIDECHEENIQLAIVGDGPLRSELEKAISSLKLDGRVRMVGP